MARHSICIEMVDSLNFEDATYLEYDEEAEEFYLRQTHRSFGAPEKDSERRLPIEEAHSSIKKDIEKAIRQIKRDLRT